MRGFDVLIVGGGVAGLSLAAALDPSVSAGLIEMADGWGAQSSGRSAALFSSSYGAAQIRNLSAASLSALQDPDPAFGGSLLRPRGLMMVASKDQTDRLSEISADVDGLLTVIDPKDAAALVPILRHDRVEAALYEEGAWDIDTGRLLDGYARIAKHKGRALLRGLELQALQRVGNRWRATAGRHLFEAAVVVIAAGAWAEEAAALAGIAPIGLVPRRRTALLIEVPPMTPHQSGWPMVVDAAMTLYFKPDAGRLMVSPVDETPTEPSDVQPEELDIAVAIDRLERATTLNVSRVAHRWAGLRTFMPDELPAIGFDADAPDGLFWLAGQGGFGIQTAPAIAALAAALIEGRRPAVDASPFEPRRLASTG